MRHFYQLNVSHVHNRTFAGIARRKTTRTFISALMVEQARNGLYIVNIESNPHADSIVRIQGTGRLLRINAIKIHINEKEMTAHPTSTPG